MTTLVLAELPSAAAERYRLLVADTLDAAREQLQQAYDLFRLLGVATFSDRPEAHRFARLIRSHARSTGSTGAMAFSDRSLRTALSILKPLAAGEQEEGQVPEEVSETKADEPALGLRSFHPDAALLWTKASLAAVEYVSAAHHFNRELRIELGARALQRIRRELLHDPADPDSPSLRPARLAFLQWAAPERLPEDWRGMTTSELQHEPFQPMPSGALAVRQAAPAPKPKPVPAAAAPSPQKPTPASKGKATSWISHFLGATAFSAMVGLFCSVPLGTAGAFFGALVVGPISCGSAGGEQATCIRKVSDTWLIGGAVAGGVLLYSASLLTAGRVRALEEAKR